MFFQQTIAGMDYVQYEYFQPRLKWVGVLNFGIVWMLWLDNLVKTLMNFQVCLQGERSESVIVVDADIVFVVVIVHISIVFLVWALD